MKDKDDSIFSIKILLWLILLSLPGSAAVLRGVGSIFLWALGISCSIYFLLFIFGWVGSKSVAPDEEDVNSWKILKNISENKPKKFTWREFWLKFFSV